MKNTLDFTVTTENSGRLDRCLALLLPDHSRTKLQDMISAGDVEVNGIAVTQKRFQVNTGSNIRIALPVVSETENISPEPFGFDILFEDRHFLVINKPAGVVVHPGAGNHNGTVVNALLSRYPDFAAEFASDDASRPGIIHRLDKDTSGCLAVAKTMEAKFKLGKAFADRQTEKKYFAICRGIPQTLSGELKNLIGRHPVNRQKMAIVERNGKEAHTQYRITARKVIANIPLALAEVQIFTGRTHQIRVHLSSLGLPILGDGLYGRNNAFPGVLRQMLHAGELILPHPVTGEKMKFVSPLPDDFKKIKELILQ